MANIKKEDRRHLFLRLYESDITEIPLAERIADFDKSEPLRFYKYGDSDRITQRHFRNLDQVFLEHKAVSALLFTMNYLFSLERQNKVSKITLQEIFELSMLTDSDFHPEDDLAFNDAYIDDAKRYEIDLLGNYYRMLIWEALMPSDLEFKRRVQESLLYYSSINGLHLDNGQTISNKFVTEEFGFGYTHRTNAMFDDFMNMYMELLWLEEELVENLQMPNGVHFDGSRFVPLILDAPIKPMLDIVEKPETVYIADKVRTYPTKMIPSYDDQDAVHAANSFFNVRQDFMLTEHTDLLDFTKNVMYNGFYDGEKVSDILKAYNNKRNVIVSKYKHVTDNVSEFMYKLMRNMKDRKVFIFTQTHNGYVAIVYGTRRTGRRLARILSYAIFYDQDGNRLYKTSYYDEYRPQRKELSGLYEKSYDAADKEIEYDYVLKEHCRRISISKRILSIDYLSGDIDNQVGQCIKLASIEKPHLVPLAKPAQISLRTLTNITSANSIYSYVGQLKKQIEKNGYANVRNYARVVNMYKKGFKTVITETSIPNEELGNYGAISEHTLERDFVQYENASGNLIRCESYSALREHVEFGDVEYQPIEEIEEVIQKRQELESNWHTRAKIQTA